MLEPAGRFPFDAVGDFVGVVQENSRMEDQVELDVSNFSGFPGFKKVVAFGISGGYFALDDFPNDSNLLFRKAPIQKHRDGVFHDSDGGMDDVRRYGERYPRVDREDSRKLHERYADEDRASGKEVGLVMEGVGGNDEASGRFGDSRQIPDEASRYGEGKYHDEERRSKDLRSFPLQKPSDRNGADDDSRCGDDQSFEEGSETLDLAETVAIILGRGRFGLADGEKIDERNEEVQKRIRRARENGHAPGRDSHDGLRDGEGCGGS